MTKAAANAAAFSCVDCKFQFIVPMDAVARERL